MIEIDNLQGAGKMLPGKVPDPLRPVSHDDFLFRAAPAPLPGFHIELFAKLLGGFDGADVRCGIRVSDGETLLVPSGLSEHASQLGFTRMRWLSVNLASALAISSPMASAVRSTALVVTSKSARVFICWRP
ncbi:MAG TPA: hypothetical protein VLY24_31005 [Bryobacteraceae bacterium]|nr:hypothetical protein [Bryobacteraceae bacterium]